MTPRSVCHKKGKVLTQYNLDIQTLQHTNQLSVTSLQMNLVSHWQQWLNNNRTLEASIQFSAHGERIYCDIAHIKTT